MKVGAYPQRQSPAETTEESGDLCCQAIESKAAGAAGCQRPLASQDHLEEEHDSEPRCGVEDQDCACSARRSTTPVPATRTPSAVWGETISRAPGVPREPQRQQSRADASGQHRFQDTASKATTSPSPTRDHCQYKNTINRFTRGLSGGPRMPLPPLQVGGAAPCGPDARSPERAPPRPPPRKPHA